VTFNHGVAGSSPAALTKSSNKINIFVRNKKFIFGCVQPQIRTNRQLIGSGSEGIPNGRGVVQGSDLIARRLAPRFNGRHAPAHPAPQPQGNRTARPPHFRGRGLMAKFQAVVDDSGSEPQSRMFVLAGFVGTPDDWAKFAPEWQAVLDLPPKLDYFKMTEAANLGGQFSRPRGWDESKRDDRVAALCSVIRKYSHLTVQAGVRNDFFAKYINSIPAPERTVMVDTPYVLVFTQIILAMATFGDRVGIDDACQFVFDQQEGFDGYAKMAWSNMKALVDKSARSDLARFVGPEPTFDNDKTFLPLQAADLFAWHVRRHWDRNQVLWFPLCPVLRQFREMGSISRVYDEAELQRLRQVLLKGGEIFAGNNPDIPLVRPGKTMAERKRLRRWTKGALDRAKWSVMPKTDGHEK
jgi:hypothetical protein